jgi:signal transduction histidine kinase
LRVTIEQDLPYGDFENERIYPSYLLIKNPQASDLVTTNLRHFTKDHGINSILYVPLRIGDRVRHILVFDAVDRTRYFSTEDIEILTFFGKELTQALEIERLDDILHDFKNPAIAIAGFARRVHKMISSGNADPADMLRFMDIVIHEGMRIQEMAMSLYPVSRAEMLDLGEVARDRFLINQEAIEEHKLCHIRLEEGPRTQGLMVNVSRLALERVIDNLLNNATKAVPPAGGYLRLSVDAQGEEACVEISNSGRVAAEDVARLSSADFKGRGLNIIYRLVRSMGGRVDVDVLADHTTFRVTLPLAAKNIETLPLFPNP